MTPTQGRGPLLRACSIEALKHDPCCQPLPSRRPPTKYNAAEMQQTGPVDTGLWAAAQCVVLAWQQANLKVQARDGARRSTWHVGSRIDPPPVC